MFLVLFADVVIYNDKSFIIQKVFKKENFRYLAKIDASKYCNESPDYSDKELFSKYVGTKVNIVYLTGTDIIACASLLPQIAENFHFYNIMLAVDLDSNFNPQSLLAEDMQSLKISDYTNKFKEHSTAADWVSYIVIDNVISGLTYSERRELQSSLRDIFKKSYLGFRFTNEVKPTPEMKHPLRKGIDWNEFLPRDDDGDFIITSFPVGTFKRTMIFTENYISSTDNIDGQFVN